MTARYKFLDSFFLACVIFCLSFHAFAHDAKPQYGGVVSEEKDIAYEMVSDEKGLTIHIEDHGNPVPSAGIQGRLVFVGNGMKREIALQPADGNRLVAPGGRWNIGESATAVLKMSSGRHIVLKYVRH